MDNNRLKWAILLCLGIMIWSWFAVMSDVWAHEFTSSIHQTCDWAPGPTLDIDTTEIDTGYILFDRSWINLEGYSSILIQDTDIFPGIGVRTNIFYEISDGFKIQLGLGLISFYNSKDIFGIAKSSFHQTVDIVIFYKQVFIGYRHISDYKSHASEGDMGINYWCIGYNWRF